MSTEKTCIPGGYILLARKLINSGIMQGPPMYCKLFIWMLLKVQFKDGKGLARGQFLTTISEMREAMTYWVGYRVVKPSVDQIRSAYEAFTKAAMITTRKTIRGMVVSILNYDKYQSPENYENHIETPDESSANPGITPHLYNRKKDKEVINPETISSMRARYSDQSLIDRAFQAIGSTRKSGKVSDSIIISQLRKWDRYSVAQVEAAIRIYLEKGCAGQGKRENYLCGIIRNQPPSQSGNCSQASIRQKEIDLDQLYAN